MRWFNFPFNLVTKKYFLLNNNKNKLSFVFLYCFSEIFDLVQSFFSLFNVFVKVPNMVNIKVN